MDHMINFVTFQAENFSEATTDLIGEQHGAQGGTAVQPTLLRCRDAHWVEVIVAELARIVAWNIWVVPEDSAVRIPLTHSIRIRTDRLLGFHPLAAAEARGTIRIVVCKSLVTEH